MLINFDEIPLSHLLNFNGGEKELAAHMHTDERSRILRGTLIPGASVGLHTHETSSEIMLVLEGTGKAVCDGKEERLTPGICHYCPKGHAHTVINDGDSNLVLFAVVPQQ